MTAPGEITDLIARLKTGESTAAQGLWELYFARMMRLAHQMLRDTPRRVADEEDVALSAFKSFCLGAERGRFSQLVDRNNLWPLLVSITLHKAVDLVRRQTREKRGGAGIAESERETTDLNELLGREPTPEFAAQLVEEFQQRISSLPEDSLRVVALFKLEGFTTRDIAAKLGCVPRTIERKLRVIRELWREEADP